MNKSYFVDNKEYSWIELINFASNIDSNFSNLSIKTTSKAAEVLRECGFKVIVYKED